MTSTADPQGASVPAPPATEVPAQAAAGPVAADAPVAGAAWRLYAEADLDVPVQPPRDGVPQLLNDLLVAGTSAERERLVRRALRATGFDWLSYLTLYGEPGGAVRGELLVSYANAAWEQQVLALGLDADPRLAQAAHTSLPLVWASADLDAQLAATDPHDATRHFAAGLHEAGLRSGVLFHIAVPDRPGVRTIIDLASGRAGRAWIADTVLGQALTLGFSLHEFHARHARLPAPDETLLPDLESLSALQRDIVSCLLEGLGDKAIATRLQVSAHAVDYHMRQLRRHFGAHNRVQIIRALRQRGPRD